MAGFKIKIFEFLLKPGRSCGRRFFSVLAFSLAILSPLQAQISPGELHRSHAFLEGVGNCDKCHSPQGDQLSDKCLTCHETISGQRKSGRGLHAMKEYAECFRCHVEHQGRDFDLIYFKGGQKAFEHGQTGFRLDGKHAQLNCRQCHIPRLIRNPSIKQAKDLSLESTFLGLEGTCGGCHFDEHRGQLARDCRTCHNEAGWRPAVGFNHAGAAFPLLGKHQAVLCQKCHVLEKDSAHSADREFRRYKPVEFRPCSACHADVHKGRLGANCQGCHIPDGWQTVKTAEFNHDQTRFPLRGLHAKVTCEKCHGTRSAASPLKFATCRDCHGDFHQGVFTARPGQGACEECHSVEGFRPSTFLLEQHAQTDYPLKGAHLAIPCQGCHRITSSTSGSQYRFVFKSTTCRDCHKDPHGGQVDKLVSVAGCQGCHIVNGWREIRFDHATTKFPLEGRHRDVLCRACHSEREEFNVASLKFQKQEKSCHSCHKDIHRGQFARENTAADCANCHKTDSWKNMSFDHESDSRFILEGAHLRVACNRCHLAETDDAGSFTRYRPLDIRCESCHGNKPINQGSG